MARGFIRRTNSSKGKAMGSTLAAMAMGAVALGSGAPGSTAQASIPPQPGADVVRTYAIPAGSMAGALSAFADANGFHLLYDTRLTKALKTPGLSGTYSPEQGLGLLLSGSGISYRFVRKGKAVSIVLAQADTGVQSDAGGTMALPTVEVTGQQGGQGGGAGGPPQSPAEQAGYSAPAIEQSTTKIAVPTFDLPIAIATVPEQVIVDQNAINVQDALENVSGVRSDNNNIECYNYSIRGFQTQNTFHDGLLLGTAIPQCYETANLQAVQVLKGPASFIFGRSDPGGIINLVTKTPLDTPYYSITQQGGSFDFARTVWDLTGPVAMEGLPDKAISYRFSGAYTTGGQWWDFTNTQRTFLSPAVTWKIDPSTTLTVEAEYNREDGRSNTGQVAVGMYPANVPVTRSYLEPDEPPDTIRSSLISYVFKHDFDPNWTITNRFLAARDTDTKTDAANNFLEPDNVTLDRTILYQKLTGTNYSSNLDLTGKFYVLGAKNDVLFGADYFYSFYNYILSANGSFPINIYAPVYGTIPYWEFASAAAMAWQDTENVFGGFSASQVRQLGVYAQDSITLFDNLHILAGARYDLADQHSAFEPTFAAAQAAYNSSPDAHNHAASPRIGFNFDPVPWMSYYGSYTRSFGVNNGITPQGNVIPPEIAVGWEGGVKTKLLDGRLTTTLAFFDITRSNIVTPLTPVAGRGIGLVRSQGAELDALGKLTDDLSVIASYAHIDEKVVQDMIGPGSLLGLTLDNVPRNSGSVFLTYAFPTDDPLHGWRAGGGLYAVGKRWGDDQDTFYLPAYARLDAFASYAQVIGPTKWTLQVNVKNIANTTYYTGNDTFYNFVSSFRTGIFTGTPRTVTVSLRAEF